MRIAVVGAGISGLSAAWLLSRAHDVVVYERDGRLGGHSHTVDAPQPAGGACPIDTGFIVYNTACYPNLIALFDHLRVPTGTTNMSFAVSLDNGRYEYSGNGASGLFGQPANLFSPRHWRMTADILRFFREAPRLLGAPQETAGVSLGTWLHERRYSRAFIERHILPMGAAIWSTPSRDILDFPAVAFARFFANHGLLQVSDRPEWRTVVGGSREYVRRLVAATRADFIAGDAVMGVRRTGGGVVVRLESGDSVPFDACLLACHADDALRILDDADAEENRVLGAFRYARNVAVLHTDPRHMPLRRRLWASWNYLGRRDGMSGGAVADRLSVSYYMNMLQPLATKTDHFVTLNPLSDIAPEHRVAEVVYHHPMFDAAALTAQSSLWALQGRRGTWFAGSYFGWGFHEDGLQSGLAAAEHLGGVARPWRVPGQSDRLRLPSSAAVAAPSRQALA